MKRRILLSAFLFLMSAAGVLAQIASQRDPSQVRIETSKRNQAVNNPDNNPFNRNSPTSGTGRFLNTGKIPGADIRSYVLAAQADTEVKVLSVGDGDKLLVDDGTNKVVVRILGIDAPEKGQPQYDEAVKHLNDWLTGKKVVLVYSLHNLKDEEGYFPARIFCGGTDVGLSLLENGFAWRNVKDKFYIEEKTDANNKQAQAKAQLAKTGIWQREKPQTPWKYRELKMKESKKTKKRADKS